MQKITPFLWFDGQAEEAAAFYVSVFKKSKLGDVSRYNEAGAKASGMKEGTAMTVSFEIEGMDFTALNGGPVFKFTPAISFVVACEDQKEIDHLWSSLSADGGKEMDCGWVTDKYGVSWQIIPSILPELMTDAEPEKAQAAMAALMTMNKIDIQKLKDARDAVKTGK